MTDVDAAQFESYRPLMFSIAYRMLGSASDAEDIVQEAFLRYQAALPRRIESLKAYLSAIVTRLCLNYLDSARVQRESYIGPWLPEPVLTTSEESLAPNLQAELHETISMAFLALLEQLTPLERAVFLLREVFDYEYAEIAEMTGKEEAACRQLFSRARKHIAEHRPRFKATPEIHRQMLSQFIAAVRVGEMGGLMQLLSEDVTLWADGGGKTPGAARRPISGREGVAKFVLSSAKRTPEGAEVRIEVVNGEESLVVELPTGEPMLVMTCDANPDGIHEIRVVGNPDKLQWLSRAMKESEDGVP